MNTKPKGVIAALLCATLVTGTAQAQGQDPDEIVELKGTVLTIPAGSPVTVRMVDGSQVAGRLGGVDNDGFELQMLENGSMPLEVAGSVLVNPAQVDRLENHKLNEIDFERIP